MTIGIEFDGVSEFIADIDEFADMLGRDSARLLADEALKQYREDAPVKSGDFKGGLFTKVVKRGAGFTIQFWSKADYGVYVEALYYRLADNINFGRVLAAVRRKLDRTS